jgi:hypothetical protein
VPSIPAPPPRCLIIFDDLHQRRHDRGDGHPRRRGGRPRPANGDSLPRRAPSPAPSAVSAADAQSCLDGGLSLEALPPAQWCNGSAPAPAAPAHCTTCTHRAGRWHRYPCQPGRDRGHRDPPPPSRRAPGSRSSRCDAGRVLKPVLPTRPITSPWRTRSPASHIQLAEVAVEAAAQGRWCVRPRPPGRSPRPGRCRSPARPGPPPPGCPRGPPDPRRHASASCPEQGCSRQPKPLVGTAAADHRTAAGCRLPLPTHRRPPGVTPNTLGQAESCPPAPPAGPTPAR